MDMDVECFRPTDSFLRGYDLVLNVELSEGTTVTNAVMASAPNITFWQRVFTKMQVCITGTYQCLMDTLVCSSIGQYTCMDVHIQQQELHAPSIYCGLPMQMAGLQG